MELYAEGLEVLGVERALPDTREGLVRDGARLREPLQPLVAGGRALLEHAAKVLEEVAVLGLDVEAERFAVGSLRRVILLQHLVLEKGHAA